MNDNNMIKRTVILIFLIIGLSNCHLSGYRFQYLCLANGKIITKMYNDKLTDYFIYGYYDKQVLPDSYISVSYSGLGGYVLLLKYTDNWCTLYRMNGGVFNIHNPNGKLKLQDNLYYSQKQELWKNLENSKACEIITVAAYVHSDINKQVCQCKKNNR